MIIKPLNTNIAVKIVKEDNISEGGLILPGDKKEKPEQGEIIAVGPQSHIGSGAIGQVAVFDKFAGIKAKIDGEEYVIIPSEDVLALLKEDE